MLDKIFNLAEPEGRAVYRLVNVLVPQGALGFIVFFIDEIKNIPLDGDIQVVTSVALGGLVTSYFKYYRDTKKGAV